MHNGFVNENDVENKRMDEMMSRDDEYEDYNDDDDSDNGIGEEDDGDENGTEVADIAAMKKKEK